MKKINFQDCNTDPCLILVGNKNDLWQDREGATDLACQVNFVFIFFFYLVILSRRLKPVDIRTITRLRLKRVWIRWGAHDCSLMSLVIAR